MSQTVSSSAFQMGRMLCQDPANSNYAWLFDGFHSIRAVIGTFPPKVGTWYTVYYQNGQYFIGAETDVRV